MSMRLRGRERELSLLDDRLTAARYGVGGVVVVKGPPGIGRTRLLHEVSERAAGRAGVMVLDDPHTSATVRPRQGVLWILGMRTGETPVPRPGGATVLQLGALPPPVTATIVEDFVDGRADPELLALAAQASGNPFLLTELLHGLREEDRLRPARGRWRVTEDAALPQRLVESVGEWLDRLSAPARRAARVAAVLPPRFTGRQLAGMLRVAAADLTEPLAELARHDLVDVSGDGLRLRHELVRRAVAQALPPTLRIALERDAVRTLRAAAQDVARSDPSVAADLGRRALELLPEGDEDRGALAAETIGLLHRARRLEEAKTLGDAVLAGLLPPEDEARVRLGLSTMDDGARHNRLALKLPGVAATTRARHRGWLAYHLMMRGEAGAARIQARRALADAREPQTRLLCLLVTALDGEDRLAELLDPHTGVPAHRDSHTGVFLMHIANLLYCHGRTEEAWDVWAKARHDGPLPMQYCALFHLTAGRLAEVDVDAAGSAVVRMLALAGLAAHTGDTRMAQTAGRYADGIPADAGPAARTWVIRLRARAAYDAGEPGRAADLLRDDPLGPVGPPLPVDLDHLILAARIARDASDTALARRARRAADMLGRGPVPFAGARAFVGGLLDQDGERLRTAADLLRASGRPLLAAAADEDAGRLPEALETYTGCGATADARRVTKLLRQHGAVKANHGWESLTAAELRVVLAIAAGATNRDAGRQLFLSPHTVGTHLRNAFAKLGVRSRVQLARMAHEAGRW
jgi:DNA-binding CsgD family transcriptional regulator